MYSSVRVGMMEEEIPENTYLAPCLPPLFGLTKTTKGLEPGSGDMVIGMPS